MEMDENSLTGNQWEFIDLSEDQDTDVVYVTDFTSEATKAAVR